MHIQKSQAKGISNNLKKLSADLGVLELENKLGKKSTTSVVTSTAGMAVGKKPLP